MRPELCLSRLHRVYFSTFLDALMTQADSKLGRSIVVRWRMLAEQRLEHLIELHQTGRWRRYHTEAAFHDMVREARAALKVWEELAPPDPVQDKPVEVSLEQVKMGLRNIPSASFDDLANSIRADYDLRKA
jgi:uncharacterized repeat protein (TIGR03809 family)